jgi:acetate kinase
MDTILVANAGSSSVKFQAFKIEPGPRLKRQIKGIVDGIGTHPKLRATSEGEVLVDRHYSNEAMPDLPAALQTAGAWLRDELRVNPIAVGHRVVHGGADYSRPVIVDENVLRRLEGFIPLAPLHQPYNLAPIRPLLENRPDLPQIACFDTAFHRGHGRLADHFAVPLELHGEGVRRYGFHGLSYEYVADRLHEVAPGIAQGKVIAAHLGNGASMCAMAAGKSVESTMGFTALDGLPMGTRCGQIDPGVLLYLMEQKRMSAHEVQHLLYHDCGLKGLSGISNDMRELEASPDPRAAFAIDYFVYRIALFTGALAAALGGFDALVFTAGIGENSPSLRAKVAAKLSWLGVNLDEAANIGGRQLISAPDSAVSLYVIPTDEELMIAQHTLALIRPR